MFYEEELKVNFETAKEIVDRFINDSDIKLAIKGFSSWELEDDNKTVECQFKLVPEDNLLSRLLSIHIEFRNDSMSISNERCYDIPSIKLQKQNCIKKVDIQYLYERILKEQIEKEKNIQGSIKAVKRMISDL